MLYKLFQELYITWGFIRSDILSTVIPGFLSLLAAWICSDVPLSQLPLLMTYSFTYLILTLYVFCLSNQVDSLEEDRINKPWRPLPAGMVTIKGTYTRMTFANILYLVVAYYLNIFWFAVFSQLLTFFYNRGSLSIYLGTKNLVFMTFVTFALYCSQWQIVQPLKSSVVLYITILAIWIGVSMHLQDMRDQTGDKKADRKTLPLVFGDKNARIILVIYFLILSPLLTLWMFSTQVPISQILDSAIRGIVLLISISVNWLIAYRVWMYRTPLQDHKSYTLLLYLLCYNILAICFLH